MYGVYAGYDTRELKAGPVDTTVVVTDPRTVDFQQAAVGAEFVSNQWRFDVYALIPTGDTEQILKQSLPSWCTGYLWGRCRLPDQ